MMKTAIKIDNLTKKFGPKTAVNKVSFEIYDGELFGLLGVNGAGKTTTIRMLTGLSAVTDGDAEIFGHSIKKDLQKVKPIVNVSTQETAVAGNLTVKENLELIANIYGMKKNEMEESIESIVKSLELNEVLSQKAKTLSGGWQRRLSIAMALVTKPKVIFLDEPTLGLDVIARRELWNVVTSLKGKITIILTTHYLEEAEALCDRIAVMAKGNIMALGTAEELKKSVNKTNIEDAFIEIVGGEKK